MVYAQKASIDHQQPVRTNIFLREDPKGALGDAQLDQREPLSRIRQAP